VFSELGGLYFVHDTSGVVGYWNITAEENGRLEEETGTVRRWWLPFHTWGAGTAARLSVMPHWVPTLALAVPPA
jgi:hypothetical protein